MRILVTGASGQLGSYLLRELRAQVKDQVHEVVAWTGTRSGQLWGYPLYPIDLTDTQQVTQAFREARPDIVLHCAARAALSECFQNPQAAQQINTEATTLLAELAQQQGARLLFVSTDLVFDGERGQYSEEDTAIPLSVYGRSKLAAEQPVLDRGGVVTRVCLLFGACVGGRRAFFDHQVTSLREGKPCTLFEDEWRTPLHPQTAACALLDIARSNFQGLLHIGGPERQTRLEMGYRLAAWLGCPTTGIVAARRPEGVELRPRDTSFDSSRWRQLFPQTPWTSWEEVTRQNEGSVQS